MYIATLPNGFFGSAGASWKSLSVTRISEDLRNQGYSIEVVPVNRILDCELSAEDIVIYTSSEEENIRSYIKDIMYLVSKKCVIVPNLDALMAHENKGFQQLYRSFHGFGNLEGKYFYDIDDAPKQYPFVYKSVTGAGSSGVKLINNNNDLQEVRSYFKTGLKRRLIKYIRKIHLSKQEYAIYSYRYKATRLSVSQEFIPDLKGDYKILIFGKKFFVLKREVRSGDFKASGSGIFTFPGKDEVPDRLLNFSKSVFDKLDVPYVSMDIADSNSECHLIEYQATNFGPYTLVNSPGYFQEHGRRWVYIKGSSDLEKEFSQALLDFLEFGNDKSDKARV